MLETFALSQIQPLLLSLGCLKDADRDPDAPHGHRTNILMHLPWKPDLFYLVSLSAEIGPFPSLAEMSQESSSLG